MSHAAAALIVIDAQESFRHRPYFRADDVGRYVERQQALVDGAKRLGIPLCLAGFGRVGWVGCVAWIGGVGRVLHLMVKML